MSHSEHENKLLRETLINVLRTQAKVEVMLDLQARMLSHLVDTSVADVRREMSEAIEGKVHQLAQHVLALDFLRDQGTPDPTN